YWLVCLIYLFRTHTITQSFPTRRSSDLRAPIRAVQSALRDHPSVQENRRSHDGRARGRRQSAHTRGQALGRSSVASLRTVQSCRDRKSTRLNSSHVKTSYAVFCLKKKNI